MSVDDILVELETEYCDPGGDKDGGYTYSVVLRKARQIYSRNPNALVQALKLWLAQDDIDRSLLAVLVARELRIMSLQEDLLHYRSKIERNEALVKQGLIRIIDRAIEILQSIPYEYKQ